MNDISEYLLRGLEKQNYKRMFDNLGITIKLTEMPEYMEYHRYIFEPPLLIRWFRRNFRKQRVKELKLKSQIALLISEVMELGKE